MPTFKIKKEQHWVAKTRGDNGDLVVGCVKSVRTSGEVILTNLLTGNISTKKSSVLLTRNKYVTKTQALKVVKVYNDAIAAGSIEHVARQAAREVAVGLLERERRNDTLLVAEAPVEAATVNVAEESLKAKKAKLQLELETVEKEIEQAKVKDCTRCGLKHAGVATVTSCVNALASFYLGERVLVDAFGADGWAKELTSMSIRETDVRCGVVR